MEAERGQDSTSRIMTIRLQQDLQLVKIRHKTTIDLKKTEEHLAANRPQKSKLAVPLRCKGETLGNFQKTEEHLGR